MHEDGVFGRDGKIYRGIHTPLITKELWNRVQAQLARRLGRRGRKVRRNFAFTGLITCGHCGCGMVGEIKRERYTYYHCTGSKGKCAEPYVREEVLEAQFGAALKRLAFDDEVLAWMTDALRQSHVDEKEFHAEAISRLQGDYTRLQNRIDRMYEDKLDGRVDTAFFDQKAAEWRLEQEEILKELEAHRNADQSYIEEGIQLLNLAHRAADLFAKKDPSSKRELLSFFVSNSVWSDDKLSVEFNQPFDILALGAPEEGKEGATEFDKSARFEKWYPIVDVYRTFCRKPTRNGRKIIWRMGEAVAMAS